MSLTLKFSVFEYQDEQPGMLDLRAKPSLHAPSMYEVPGTTLAAHAVLDSTHDKKTTNKRDFVANKDRVDCRESDVLVYASLSSHILTKVDGETKRLERFAFSLRWDTISAPITVC